MTENLATRIIRPQEARLRELGIRHFDELIHEQSKEWLVKHFAEGGRKYAVNVSRLLRNLVWQLRERIITKEREPLHELIRTFWYMYVKPTLARAGALSDETDQYAQVVDNLVELVVKEKLMKYSDIGFRDDNQANRSVGINPHVILFSEKLGHQEFLGEIAKRYGVSVIALGGQPSALNVEYFVDEMKKRGVDLRRSFYLFSIVDYDTSGWIIRDAFAKHLTAFGVKNTKVVDLVHPDMLTPEEIGISKYPIPEKKNMTGKNTEWLREVHARKYRNQSFLAPAYAKASAGKQEKRGGDRVIYGLESEAVSSKRIEDSLARDMTPLLGKSERLLRVHHLEGFNEGLKQLILERMT